MNISSQPITSTTEVFKANTSAINICLLYSFMMKRIVKGYSALDVDFIMGLKEDFMTDRQTLKKTNYDMVDMNLFVQMLEFNNFEGLLLTDLDEAGSSEYKLVKTTQPEIINYELFQVGKDNSETLMFRLFELNPSYSESRYTNTHNRYTRETTGLLELLFEGEFFTSSRSPFEIYKKCRNLSGSRMPPRYVKEALENMLKKRTYPKLKRNYSKYDGYSYEKVFEKIKQK